MSRRLFTVINDGGNSGLQLLDPVIGEFDMLRFNNIDSGGHLTQSVVHPGMQTFRVGVYDHVVPYLYVCRVADSDSGRA